MQYTIENLQDTKRFKLARVIHYSEIAEFVFENIRRTNFATRLYYALNLLVLAIIIGLSIEGFSNGLFSFKDYMSTFFWGFISGSIFVIPLHELMHGIAYKIKGAQKISYGVDFKQAIFYVAADKFVIDGKTFFFVALAPFISINVSALLIINFTTPHQLIMLLYFLLFHNIMCVGDFSMISYFIDNKEKKLYTYDDHNNKTSYIYESIT